MDLYWDELESSLRPRPPEDDFSHYFTEYKNFDNLFNEALTTLQDLDVPSGYPVPSVSQTSSPFRHAKKPSGTAIFGYAEHTRDLSLNNDYKMRAPELVPSISPSQLARRQTYTVSDDQLDFNFSQEDKKSDDLFVTSKLYRFPPDNPNDFLGAPIPTIRHPRQTQQYPEEIDVEKKKYVPIPVVEPVQGRPRNHSHVSPGVSGHTQQTSNQDIPPQSLSHSLPHQTTPGHIISSQSPPGQTISSQIIPGQALSDRAISQALPSETLSSPSVPSLSLPTVPENFPLELPPDPLLQSLPLDLLSLPVPDFQDDLMRPKELSMNVFLPPPIDSPNHSPLPQAYLSPRQDKRFYNTQFFSDDLCLEAGYLPSSLSSSPIKYNGLPLKYDSLPLKYDNLPIRYDSLPLKYDGSPVKYDAFDDTVDANETILQVTPHKSTPKKVTLEWSPVISPDSRTATDMRRAIQQISPKRVVKKTSLLPPGELDRYWEGPDENKVFTCTYKNCGKKFTRRYNVRSHIQTHLLDRPFTCMYCPKSFVRQHDLNRHIKSHQVSKHCRCSCGKEFTRVEGYRKHLSNGICSRTDGVLKPRPKMGDVLDSLTSNRLNDELGL